MNQARLFSKVRAVLAQCSGQLHDCAQVWERGNEEGTKTGGKGLGEDRKETELKKRASKCREGRRESLKGRCWVRGEWGVGGHLGSNADTRSLVLYFRRYSQNCDSVLHNSKVSILF